jgi:hypothetical protein
MCWLNSLPKIVTDLTIPPEIITEGAVADIAIQNNAFNLILDANKQALKWYWSETFAFTSAV